MKLPSLKLSMSVLMLTIIQSGYGVSNWFMEACRALNRGDITTAQRITAQNNPSSLIMTNENKKDFVAETKKLIKNDVDNFIPRGIEGAAKDAFQEEVIKTMIALTDITDKSIQDSFKNTIVLNFYKNIGWLGRNEAVYNEVTKVTTVYANSYVPGTSVSDTSPALLGRIEEFLAVYLSTSGDVESKKTALTTLLSGENLTAFGADELDNTYYAIKGKVDAVPGAASTRTADDVKAEQKAAVYTALKSRENIRNQCLKEKVAWNQTQLETASVPDTIRTASDRAESLRKTLYNGVVGGVIDSNKLSIYLSLFGYWKVDQQEFLQKILGKISGGSDIENAVYSTFGEEYENLLRHSANDSNTARQKKLVDAVSKISSESTDDQKLEGVAGSIETLDNATASRIRSSVEVLKKVS